MNETLETILRIAIIVGFAFAIWNFNASMERIADALTRIADRDSRNHEANDAQG